MIAENQFIRGVKAHFQAIKAALAGRMAYRGDFLLSTIIMLMAEMFAPAITFLIYSNGASFPGWGIYEVLLIQSIFMMARGIAFPFFFGMVWNTLSRVREGTLDILLIKPLGLVHLIIMTAFDCNDIGKLFGGVLLFAISMKHLPFPGFMQWVQFLLLFILSLVMLFAFALIMSALAIVWVGNSRIFEMFSAVTSFSQYPLSIFSKPIQTFITVIIPLGLLGFFPASVLLGKYSPQITAAIVSSIFFLIASFWFFKKMVRQYTSTGG